MKKIILFGTSRLHRPFCKVSRGDRVVINNILPGIEVIFPKMGYFHTSAEILQAIRFIKDPEVIPMCLRRYSFRIEPRWTTPMNEFDQEMEKSIRMGRPFRSSFSLDGIDAVVIEISSLTQIFHKDKNIALHSNPNFDLNIPYSELYPEGFYKKFAQNIPVRSTSIDEDVLGEQLIAIRDEFPSAQLIVIGHLRSEKYSNIYRDKIHNFLLNTSVKGGFIYFDCSNFLDEYGWAFDKNGNVDKHHLSNEGEREFGIALQS